MSQDARKQIAKKVFDLRTKAKISREELSLKLGFDNSYISKLEREKINITIDKIELIASFFNIKIKDFFM